MADRTDGGLFGELVEQAAPARPGAGAPRRRRPERRQVALRAVSLDALVAPEHRVRLVWRFVEGLDLAPRYAGSKALEGRPGHPPADPRLLLALWLYATVEGVGSARALARLGEEHLAFEWRCGGVGMKDGRRRLSPGRQVQFAGDTPSGAVAGVAVDNLGSDMGRMAPMSEALAAAYGTRAGAASGRRRLRQAGRHRDPGRARRRRLRAGAAAARGGPRPPRAAPRADPPAVAAWRRRRCRRTRWMAREARRRMATDEAKAIYKERAATAECINAQARNRGLTRFLVRGLAKVKAVALWHALAHNMACTWRLAPT